jgi:hypothetical protein
MLRCNPLTADQMDDVMHYGVSGSATVRFMVDGQSANILTGAMAPLNALVVTQHVYSETSLYAAKLIASYLRENNPTHRVEMIIDDD